MEASAVLFVLIGLAAGVLSGPHLPSSMSASTTVVERRTARARHAPHDLAASR
jgi:hypothetical protein